MQMRRLGYLLAHALATIFCATSGFAQDGKLKIKVTPKQAYVFVDGQAIRDGSQSIPLAPGKHTVVVVNYGYKMESAMSTSRRASPLLWEVTLQAYGSPVAGPYGKVIIEGDPGHPWCSPTAPSPIISWAMWMSLTMTGPGFRIFCCHPVRTTSPSPTRA